jgi:hypothetical protein
MTKYEAKKGKVISIDFNTGENKTVVEQKKLKLTGVDIVNNDRLLLAYQHKKSDAFFVSNLTGSDLKMIELPSLGDIKEYWSYPTYDKVFMKFDGDKAHKNVSGTYIIDLNKGNFEVISLKKDFAN